jgi:hypothetical protein
LFRSHTKHYVWRSYLHVNVVKPSRNFTYHQIFNI